MHEAGIIHGRLSPDKFVIGLTPNDTVLYLTGFREARIYNSKQKRCIRKMDVDFEFMSRKKHEDGELTWKDDFESLCYMLVYFLKGELPWTQLIKNSVEFIKNGDSVEELSRKVLKMKKEIDCEELCDGLPKIVLELLQYCVGLHEFEKPHFEVLKEKFKELYFGFYEEWDFVWDWSYIKVELLE